MTSDYLHISKFTEAIGLPEMFEYLGLTTSFMSMAIGIFKNIATQPRYTAIKQS